MKKILILLVFITMLVSCMSDESYMTHGDLIGEANLFCDDPMLFTQKYFPIQAVLTVSEEIKKEESSPFQTMVRRQRIRDLKEIRDLYGPDVIVDTFGQSTLNDIIEEVKEYPIKSLDKLGNNVLFGAILFAPLEPALVKSKGRIGVTKAEMLSRKVAVYSSKNFTPFIHYIDRKAIKIERGNTEWGMKHVVKRHSPYAYMIRNKYPNIGTHLFLKSEINFIVKLIKKVNKNNSIISYEGKYTVYTANIKSLGVKRTYELVVDGRSGNMITFYPKTRLSKGMKRKVESVAINYLDRVEQRDINIEKLKLYE